MTTFEARGADRVEELVVLARRDEAFADLSADELLLACHERGGVVLAADGVGAVAVALGRGIDGGLVASVRLLVIDGIGGGGDEAAEQLHARRRLLEAAEQWAIERSADRLVLGGGLPFALVPGVVEGSAEHAAALAGGFRDDVAGRWASYLVPTSHRSQPPAGVEIRRAVRDDDVALVLLAASARWPRRSDEIARALDHGTCHVAVEERGGVVEVVGIATHSIARAGWTGPLVVVDEARRRGIGRALLGQICRDLMIAEFPHLVVGDASTPAAAAFLESVGGVVDRRWVTIDKRLDRSARSS